jgi:hypothetical protein
MIVQYFQFALVDSSIAPKSLGGLLLSYPYILYISQTETHAAFRIQQQGLIPISIANNPCICTADTKFSTCSFCTSLQQTGRSSQLAGALVLKVAIFLVVVPLQTQNTCLDGGFEVVAVGHAGYVIEAVFGIGEFAFAWTDEGCC